MTLRRDLQTIAAVTIAIVVLLALYQWSSGMSTMSGNAKLASDSVAARQVHAREAKAAEVQSRFAQASVMLHAKQYDYAIAALHRVLELAPDLPEAHVNMGYALLGNKRFAAARDFFEGALALRPTQANAYYGLAIAHEALADLPGALGAMRTYVHLADNSDPHMRRARAAIWEWEQARTTTHAYPAEESETR